MTDTSQQSARSIGIGIIGTGEITRIMRPAFTGFTQSRVVAVADVNMDAARAEAEALGGAGVGRIRETGMPDTSEVPANPRAIEAGGFR